MKQKVKYLVSETSSYAIRVVYEDGYYKVSVVNIDNRYTYEEYWCINEDALLEVVAELKQCYLLSS